MQLRLRHAAFQPDQRPCVLGPRKCYGATRLAPTRPSTDDRKGQVEVDRQPALIDLPTGQLLAKFGAGNATPGSGSAAALMSLLSASLICAVAKMTVRKGRKEEVRERARVMAEILEDRVTPRLKELFEEDTRLFQLVIEARIRRDDPAQSSTRRKNVAEASERLREATNILFEIVDLSFQILDNGIAIWDFGFQPAMGDAGAGISAALAAVTTCLLVAHVNLRSARSSWSVEAKSQCDDIQRRMTAAQDRVFSLVYHTTEKTEETLRLSLESGVRELDAYRGRD